MLLSALGMGIGPETCPRGVDHLEGGSYRNPRNVVQGKEMDPRWEVGRVRVQGDMKEILMQCFPESSQDRERFLVEIKEEHGMFEMHGDTVISFVL